MCFNIETSLFFSLILKMEYLFKIEQQILNF